MRTRFAPSPTGPLHLGHAYSALLAYDMAQAAGGEFLLRIEDIDQSRARPEWEAQIYDDLAWLDIWWPKPVMRQSEQMKRYKNVITQLWNNDALFACSCNRRDIIDATNAPQEEQPPLSGPDGLVYPGICRANGSSSGIIQIPQDSALRLNMSYIANAYSTPRVGGNVFSFYETGSGPNGETGLIEFSAEHAITNIGDIVLSRRDMGTSYHLSVVLDDAEQKITHVIRGNDLFEATKIHVILQQLLGLPTPIYHHHGLIRDAAGKRLAKRDDARAIAKFRADGLTPADVRKLVGL